MPRLASTLATSLLAAVVVAWPADASAKEDTRGRPWDRGTVLVGPTIGLGFSSDLTLLSLGVVAEYFVVPGLSFGIDFSDTIYIYHSSFKSSYPDVERQIANNALHIIPRARYVFFRSYRFSPYVYAGVGPVFFNHGGTTVGEWVAGPGAFIGLAGPVHLILGVNFSGTFPESKCEEAFTYNPPVGGNVVFDLGCGFGWGPTIGVAITPGAGSKRKKKPPPRREPERNPMSEPPPPVVVPVDTGEVPPQAPTEPATEASPPTEPVPSPTEPAPPPGEPPAEAPPPGESPPPPAATPPSEVPPAEVVVPPA